MIGVCHVEARTQVNTQSQGLGALALKELLRQLLLKVVD